MGKVESTLELVEEVRHGSNFAEDVLVGPPISQRANGIFDALLSLGRHKV